MQNFNYWYYFPNEWQRERAWEGLRHFEQLKWTLSLINFLLILSIDYNIQAQIKFCFSPKEFNALWYILKVNALYIKAHKHCMQTIFATFTKLKTVKVFSEASSLKLQWFSLKGTWNWENTYNFNKTSGAARTLSWGGCPTWKFKMRKKLQQKCEQK